MVASAKVKTVHRHERRSFYSINDVNVCRVYNLMGISRVSLPKFSVLCPWGTKIAHKSNKIEAAKKTTRADLFCLSE